MAALEEIDADIENVRTAWRYCLGQLDTSRIRMFMHSIRLAYTIRGWNYAGEKLFAEAVEALSGVPDDEEAETQKAAAMAYQGFFMAWLGLAHQGIEFTRQGAEVLRRLSRPVDLALALNGQNLCAIYLDLHQEAVQAGREMLQIATEHNDAWLEAFSLFPLGVGHVGLHDYAAAQDFAERSLQISEEIGDAVISLHNLLVLGAVAANQQDYDQAAAHYQRSKAMSEKLGYRWAIENASKYLGIVALAINEIDRAEDYLRQSLRIAEEIGLGRDLVNLIYEFARVRVVQDGRERAIELLTLVIKQPASRQSRFGEGLIQDNAQDLLDELERDMLPETFAAAVERGKVLQLDEVVAALTSTDQ
jgi:tetratricopeptide (TPR) repeat protein